MSNITLCSGNTTVDYLDIPFEMKDQYKRYLLWDSRIKSWETRRFSAFGIRWNNKKKEWYHDQDEAPTEVINKYRRIYLDVPFDEKDFVKENGGRWDANKKKWHTIASNEALQKYMPENYLYEELKSYFHFDEKEISSWKE
jgi:hypothetical protein